MENLLEILGAGLGAAGFSFVYSLQSKKRFTFFSALLGALSWLIYLLVFNIFKSEYASFFVASLTVALISEKLARILKTPAAVLLIPAIFPLVPGGKIYQTMLFAIQGESQKFLSNLIDTLAVSFSISLGILISTTIVLLMKNIKKQKN